MSEWIKCSDRLPMDELTNPAYETMECIAYSKSTGVITAWYAVGGCHVGKRWGQWSVTYADITHWMPLPEPPKE